MMNNNLDYKENSDFEYCLDDTESVYITLKKANNNVSIKEYSNIDRSISTEINLTEDSIKGLIQIFIENEEFIDDAELSTIIEEHRPGVCSNIYDDIKRDPDILMGYNTHVLIYGP